MVLPITLSVAAAAALVNLWLGLRVSLLRARRKAMVGDGSDPAVQARMRAHANFVEYAPVALVLLALIELAGGRPGWLWAAGGLFVLARLIHPIGMDRPAPNPWRAGGIGLTWAVTLWLAGWAAAVAWQDRGAPPAGPAIELDSRA